LQNKLIINNQQKTIDAKSGINRFLYLKKE